jgi:hypothetical protein
MGPAMIILSDEIQAVNGNLFAKRLPDLTAKIAWD